MFWKLDEQFLCKKQKGDISCLVSFHLYSSSIISSPCLPSLPSHMKSYFEIIKSSNVTMATRQARFMRTALKQMISPASHTF